MATLPSLQPNAPVTNNSITVVGTGVAWEVIDDDPDSPDTADYVFDAGTTNGDLVVGLTDMPSDFASMGGTLTVRAVTQAVSFVDDTDTLTARITDSAGTTLTNTLTLSTQANTTQALRTAALTVNSTGLAASKATWDDARLHLVWTYTASMSKDNGSIRVYALEVDGTYTQADPGATRTPDAIAATTTTPAATARGSVTPTPAAIAVVDDVPLATVAIANHATPAPDVIAATAALPAPIPTATIEVVVLTAAMRMGAP